DHEERLAAGQPKGAERVHEPVGRLLQVPERVPLPPAALVLPVEGDAAPVGGPGVDQGPEVELVGELPAELGHQVLVATTDGDHAAAILPCRADASMYFRETGDRSSGLTTAS